MLGRNDPCWCGSQKKWKKCHFPIIQQESSFDKLKREYYKKYRILIKSTEEQKKIKNACKLTAFFLREICSKAKVGVTTNELNEYANELHKKYNAKPAPLYENPPFPKSICTSLNEEICHGIPNDRPLQNGDILNIDVSTILDGYFGDCSQMVLIGEVDSEKKRVCEAANKCLESAINILKPNVLLHEIGDVIEECAASYGCSVVNQFVGHGVGLALHEPPQVPHHKNHLKIPLVPGMIFTIEPMINAGVREGVFDPTNQWVVRTRDGKASAQCEHTLLITEQGHEILTLQGEGPLPLDFQSIPQE